MSRGFKLLLQYKHEEIESVKCPKGYTFQDVNIKIKVDKYFGQVE